MCLKRYQYFEHWWAKGQGLESPWALAMFPGSNHNPCDGGVLVHLGMCFCSLEVLLDSSFAFIDHPAAMPSTDVFHHQLARKFISGGTQLILPASFPVPFSGTQLTSVGCRTWQRTQAECHTSSSLHHITTCSSCLITPRYRLCCLWLMRC